MEGQGDSDVFKTLRLGCAHLKRSFNASLPLDFGSEGGPCSAKPVFAQAGSLVPIAMCLSCQHLPINFSIVEPGLLSPGGHGNLSFLSQNY